jgi:hypothetical protein
MAGLLRLRAWSVLALLARNHIGLGVGCPVAATRMRCWADGWDRAAARRAHALGNLPPD